MTWPDVAAEFVTVLGILGFLFFLAVVVNGWPGEDKD